MIQNWLTRIAANFHMSHLKIPVREKVDHCPDLIAEIADRIERHPDDESEMVVDAATKYGKMRK